MIGSAIGRFQMSSPSRVEAAALQLAVLNWELE
jgi:hypothetical protein